MYDLIIIGAGPAGLTASIYASCYHLSHLVIGKELGGQLQYAPDILNYPGFTEISGKELTERIVDQVKKRGGELVIGMVVKITHLPSNISNSVTSINNESCFDVETQEGNKYQGRAIILATGTERRKLNVPGEVEYTSRGVYYCATCEKQDYEGKICGVVGGANSAIQAAVELSQAASKVYIIYRGSELRGDPIWIEQVGKNSKIEVMYNTIVTEIVGDGEKVIGVKLESSSIPNFSDTPPSRSNTSHGPISTAQLKQSLIGRGRSSKLVSSDDSNNNGILSLDKLFIEIGGVPGTALVVPLGVEVDSGGYIRVDEKLATNIPGVFAAGDLVSYGLSIEQISSAVGLGARASASVFAFIKKGKPPSVWGTSQIKR